MERKIKIMSSHLELAGERNGEWQHGKIKIILFSGKAGTGKTTCANILKDLIQHDFLLVDIDSFAKGVKYEATKQGWDGEKDAVGRKLLQDVGRAGRERDPNTWVNQVIERAMNPIPKDVVIVDDWRYPNELNRLRNNKSFEVISIRIHDPKREILSGTSEANDSSEVALPIKNDMKMYDFYISNSENIEELEQNLIEIIEEIIK